MKEIRLCDNSRIDIATELCKRYNIGIEIQTFANPYIENQNVLITNYKEKLINLSTGRSLHAPFWDMNPGAKLQEVRKVTLDMVNYAYSIAKKLNCTEIVVHNGFIPKVYDQEEWIKRASDFWGNFFADKDNNITVCLENQFENDPELIKKEIELVNDKRLKVCLDIGHANCFSDASVEKWITTLEKKISYFHLHSNHGKRNVQCTTTDEHLGLGHGKINFKKILKLMEKVSPNSIWNIEVADKYVEESILYLEKLNYLKR